MKRRGVEHSALPLVDGMEKWFREDVPGQDNRRALRNVEDDGDQEMVRHGQAPDHGVLGSDLQSLVRDNDPVADGFMTEHHAFACARGARSEPDEGDVEAVIVGGWRCAKGAEERSSFDLGASFALLAL